MCGGGGSSKVKASKGEKKMAKVAKAEWADYKKRYIPVENSFIEQVRSLENEDDLAISRAVADTAQAYDPVRKRREAQLMGRGVNPNSGRFNAEMQDLGLAKAATTSKGTNSAKIDSENRFIKGLTMAVKNGRDIADSANLGFRQNAEVTASNARAEAKHEQEIFEQNLDAVGTVAGAAYGQWGGQMQSGLQSAWNKAGAYSGNTYNTGFGSQQSRMLAAQEF